MCVYIYIYIIYIMNNCYWNDVVDKQLFCESKQNDGGWEVENSVSNIAYFVASFALIHQQKKCFPCLKTFPLTILLLINSFGSTFYHVYKTRGWGSVDGTSMIVLQAMSIYLLLAGSEHKKLDYYNRVLFNFIIIGLTLFTIICDLAEIKTSLDDNRTMFDILFGTMTMINIVLVLFFTFSIPKKRGDVVVLHYTAWKILLMGILGSLFWFLTEGFCDVFHSTHGHIFWHLLSAFVAYHLIIFVTYKRLENIGEANVEFALYTTEYTSWAVFNPFFNIFFSATVIREIENDNSEVSVVAVKKSNTHHLRF